MRLETDMKLDVIYHEQTRTVDLPQADFIGIRWGDGFGINTAFPAELGGTPVISEHIELTLPDGSVLSLYLYTFSGRASVLSLKPYKGLVFAEVTQGEVSLRITV